MAEEQQRGWDTAPLQGTGTMAGARDKKPYFYSNHENCAGAITTLLRHVCFQSPSAPPGSSRLPHSLRPRRDELQNFSRPNTEEEGRAKSYRAVCGRVEAGIPTAPEADGEPHSSSSSPGKRTGEGGSAPARPGRPSVSALPRALRRPGAAARMEEEEEQEGGGGRGAAGGRAASARFVRCLYAVGFLVSHGAREREPAPFQAKGCWLRGASPQLRLGSERQCLQRWWRVAAGLFYPCKQPRSSIHRSDFYPVNAME